MLPSAVMAFLPTPSAGNFNDGESLESWEARKAAQKARGINGNGMGTPLTIAVQKLYPTPRASDTGTPGRRASEGFRPPLSQVILRDKSPGGSSSPRSAAGNAYSDGLHPGQLSLDELATG